jgi:hypothetical protein
VKFAPNKILDKKTITYIFSFLIHLYN